MALFCNGKIIEVSKVADTLQVQLSSLSNNEQFLYNAIKELNKLSVDDGIGGKEWKFRKLDEYLPLSEPISGSDHDAYAPSSTRGGNLLKSGSIKNGNGIHLRWEQGKSYTTNSNGSYTINDRHIMFRANEVELTVTDIEEAFVLYYLRPECQNGYRKNEKVYRQYYELFQPEIKEKEKFELKKLKTDVLATILSCSDSDLLKLESNFKLNSPKGTSLNKRRSLIHDHVESLNKIDVYKKVNKILDTSEEDLKESLLFNEALKKGVLYYDEEKKGWYIKEQDEGKEDVLFYNCPSSQKDDMILELLKVDKQKFLYLTNVVG